MDVQIAWDTQALRADLVIADGGFALDAGLRTAVLVSLFTDRVAAPDYVPPPGGSQDRRGWWGDTFRARPIGSRLWQLNRAKKSGQADIPNRARDYCIEALQWMIASGIVKTIAVTTGWQIGAVTVLGIAITITKPSGVTVPFAYEWVWQGA